MKSFNTKKKEKKKHDRFVRLKVRVGTIWVMIDKSYISLPPHAFIGCDVKNDKLATSYRWVGEDKNNVTRPEKNLKFPTSEILCS
jgi:hypothetical protein